MAHYAFLDANSVVTEVIVGRDEDEDGIDWEQYYGDFRGQVCKRTSYNHKIRKRFAGIGFIYDPIADVFIAPQPFNSWSLNQNHDWQAPIPYPEFGDWIWDEETTSWVSIPNEE